MKIDPTSSPKLYWIYKNGKNRIKIDDSNLNQELVDLKQGLCFIYIYLDPLSPPAKLTINNLKIHSYKKQEEEQQSSRSSRDSNQ